MANAVYDDTKEVVGVAAGLATGAAAFAVGLVAAPVSVPSWARWFLVAAIVLVAISIVGLLGVRGGIIFRRATGTGKLDDLRILLCVALLVLGLGCLAVLVALVATMLNAPDQDSYSVRSAYDALRTARTQVQQKPCRLYDRVPTVELIRGFDSSGPKDTTWHIHFDLRKSSQKPAPVCPASYDVYIEAKSGKITLL